MKLVHVHVAEEHVVSYEHRGSVELGMNSFN